MKCREIYRVLQKDCNDFNLLRQQHSTFNIIGFAVFLGMHCIDVLCRYNGRIIYLKYAAVVCTPRPPRCYVDDFVVCPTNDLRIDGMVPFPIHEGIFLWPERRSIQPHMRSVHRTYYFWESCMWS